MRINVMQTLKSYEGKDIKLVDEKGNVLKDAQGKERIMTFRSAASTALNSQLRTEVLTGEEKAKIYAISTKLFDKKEVDLTVDQLALIKARAGKILTPVACGRVCEIVDNKPGVERPQDVPKPDVAKPVVPVKNA